MNAEKRNKHFTTFEKQFFLEILLKYKHVIECKKSNTLTLKEKDTAWTKICREFNDSPRIMHERTVQQLKKLWSNLKQQQRDIMTKEKQQSFLTGGGPYEKPQEVDPTVQMIVPSIMATAPTLFSCNLLEEDMENALENLNAGPSMETNEMEVIENSKEAEEECNILQSILKDTQVEANKKVKRKTLEELEVVRMENIIAHEKRIHALEIRAATAKAELAELLLQKELTRTS